MLYSFAFRKLSLSGIFLTLMFILGWYTYHLQQQIKELNFSFQHKKHKTLYSKETAAYIQKFQEQFTSFETSQFDQPLSPNIFKNLAEHSFELGQSFSKIIPPKNIVLIHQDVSISMACLHDKDIFSYIDHLINKGPGFFQIHDITIKRSNSLNDDVLEKIATGETPILCEGKIVATWIHQ